MEKMMSLEATQQKEKTSTAKMMILIVVIMTLFIGSIGAVTKKAEAANQLPFTDIANHWAKDNILKAYESGLVDGFPDGTFKPDDVVTADQFIVMMLRAHSVTVNGKTEFDPEWYEFMEESQPGFLDKIKQTVQKQKFNFKPATSGYWAKPFIDFIYETPFIFTFDIVFPKDYNRYKKQIKREEASYLLGLWYTSYVTNQQPLYSEFVLKNSGLSDFDTFGQYEGIYRDDVLIAGLMNGYPDKRFYPKRYVTRAEALTMAQRLRNPSLRKPFKPVLKGQYWIEQEGQIYLFSDKYKHDVYKKFIELAKNHVKNGFVYSSGGSSVRIFKSKDDYEKYQYMTRTLQLENRPLPEMTAVVDFDIYRTVGVAFPSNSNFENSKEYLNAIFELLAGNGKGKDLKKKIDGYINDGISVKFDFNGKKFEFYNHGKLYEVRLNY